MATIIANNNLALRLVSIWFNDSGLIEVADQAVIGWSISEQPAYPLAIPAGGHPARPVVARLIFDRETKTWADSEGNVYREWAAVVGPLHEARDLTHPPAPPSGALDWPLDEKYPKHRSEPRDRPKGTSGGIPPGHR